MNGFKAFTKRFFPVVQLFMIYLLGFPQANGAQPGKFPDIPGPGTGQPTDEVQVSVNASVGMKFMEFSFLEKTVEVPTLSIGMPVSFAHNYFFSINLDRPFYKKSTSKNGIDGQVHGEVERFDISTQFGYVLAQNDRSYFSPVFISLGYTNGYTDLRYDDGVKVKFNERGPFFLLSSNVYQMDQYHFSASLGYAYLSGSSLSVRTNQLDKVKEDGTASGINVGVSAYMRLAKAREIYIQYKFNKYQMTTDTDIVGTKITEDFHYWGIGYSYSF